MGDLTVIILAILMVVMCWIIIKVNEKTDRYIKRFKKLEKALLKNATGKIPVSNQKTPPTNNADIPVAATHTDLHPDRQIIAKSKTD
jgi:hypothetical protein